MTDSEMHASEPSKLTDEAMAEVSGGGIWNDGIEASAHHAWDYGRIVVGAPLYQCEYEEWIKNQLAEYDAWAIEDRQYWIWAGCPKEGAYANHGGRR